MVRCLGKQAQQDDVTRTPRSYIGRALDRCAMSVLSLQLPTLRGSIARPTLPSRAHLKHTNTLLAHAHTMSRPEKKQRTEEYILYYVSPSPQSCTSEI